MHVPPTIEVYFPIRVSNKINAWLRAYPRIKEVQFTSFSMPRNKSLGPDGITTEI